MILFWAICGMFLLIALAFVLPPLLQGAPLSNASGANDANLAVYRDQLADLESDLRAGVVADEQFERDREELERRLLEDLPADAGGIKAAKAARSPVKVTAILAVGLPLAAVLLYLKLGNPNALFAVPSDGQVTSVPADAANQWLMVARSYSSLGKYREASDAFERATALVNTDADLLVEYAHALSMANGRGLQGKPADLIERALELDPDNAKALALAGNAAFEARDYRRAIAYWERLQRAVPSGSELAEPLSRRIGEAKELADQGRRR